jgi:asparagine synthetase B (glutamine-hydrolysing)
MWLITTLLLAVAVLAAWAQQHLVDRDGYSALAQRAAADPGLQSAMAGELTAQVGLLGSSVDSSVVSRIAAAYTSSSAFPEQFAQANEFAHRQKERLIALWFDAETKQKVEYALKYLLRAFKVHIEEYDDERNTHAE